MTLQERAAQYSWYHDIEIAPGIRTPSPSPFRHIWDFIIRQMSGVNFSGKSVMDVGCRDGLFSFEAEALGASVVVGIDNDLSAGAVEFLIPHFGSKVRMHEKNLLLLDPGADGPYDIAMMFGVLYHLRYPFYGLRRVLDIVKPGGLLLIEGGMFSGIEDIPLMYCPWKDSPYEPGSPSFFNLKGLSAALDSMGATLRSKAWLPGSDVRPGTQESVRRGFFVFEKTHTTPEHLHQYWDLNHGCQSGKGDVIR